MDCIVHGVTKNQTQLSDFHFHFQEIARQRERNFNHSVSTEEAWLVGKVRLRKVNDLPRVNN